MKSTTVVIFIVLSAMFAIPLSAYDKFRDLYPLKPKYIKRSGFAWNKFGRFVGVLKHPPEALTIKFFNIATGKMAYIYKAPGQLNIYMSKFLPPGSYRVTISSPGFHSQTVKKVKLKAHADCLLNIRFGLKVYVNN